MKIALRFIAAALVAFVLSGCVGGVRFEYEADEVHRTISAPGFSDEIHATGISRQGNVRRADTLTHSTTVMGFARTATYKGARLEVIPEDEAAAEDDSPPAAPTLRP